MRLETMTLDDALKLLSLPRRVGESVEGRPIDAKLGPYGPYINDGKESRSLQSEEQVFTVTVEEARALLAQPKAPMRRAKGVPREPLKTLGEDPVSKKTIVLRQGKFGYYVTDGDTNATLKQGDMHDSITPERAQELLQLRRDREVEMGGSGAKPAGRGRRGSTAKSASAKAASKPKKAAPTEEVAAAKKPLRAAKPAAARKKTPKAKKSSRAKLSSK
jgi:DNA topoisomerase-1